jgi:hypothetical protein
MAQYGSYQELTNPAGSEVILVKRGTETLRLTVTNLTKGLSQDINTEILQTGQEITALQNDKVAKSGDTMTGDLNMGANKVTTTATPSADADLTTKKFVDDTFLKLAGGTLTGTLTLNGAPSAANDAATKTYADGAAKGNYVATSEDYDPTTTSAFPTTYASAAIKNGALFYISAAGTMASASVTVEVGDIIIAKTDSPTDAAADWIVVQTNIKTASTSEAGVVEIATDTEAQALTATDKVITPGNLGAVLNAESIYNITTVTTQTYTITEGDAGIINSTYNTGNRTITLPAISSLTNSDRFRVKIVHAGTDKSYGIQIATSGGDSIKPLSVSNLYLTFPSDYVDLYTDGTSWYVGGFSTLLGCAYEISANQTITDSTWTKVQFDQIKGTTKDPFTWMDLVTNYWFAPNSIGTWVVNMMIEFDANATGQRGIRLMKDGETNPKAQQLVDTAASGNTVLSISADMAPTSSAAVYGEVYQSSGGNLDILTGQECRLKFVSIKAI